MSPGLNSVLAGIAPVVLHERGVKNTVAVDHGKRSPESMEAQEARPGTDKKKGKQCRISSSGKDSEKQVANWIIGRGCRGLRAKKIAAKSRLSAEARAGPRKTFGASIKLLLVALSPRQSGNCVLALLYA
jgi:hypothetical protein